MRTTFKAVLFHPDGSSVTDFTDSKTASEVWDKINDMGSRWIFYPLPFVVTEGGFIRETLDEFECFKGKRVETLRRFLLWHWERNKENICEVINNGFPLSLAY